MNHFSVAVDGPAGAGKSTLARAAAERLGFIYVDTGAIYRTVGLAVKCAGIDRQNAEEIAALLPDLSISIRYTDGVQHMMLNGEDVSDLIRTPEMSVYASSVSALPAVRSFLMDMQRQMAREQDVIMDGRDIGTVVLPDAGLKVFLTASPEKRAMRRFRELTEKGVEVTYEEVLADMNDRDRKDSTRDTAPLKAAEDAVRMDTSDLSLEESLDALEALIRSRMAEKEMLK